MAEQEPRAPSLKAGVVLGPRYSQCAIELALIIPDSQSDGMPLAKSHVTKEVPYTWPHEYCAVRTTNNEKRTTRTIKLTP